MPRKRKPKQEEPVAVAEPLAEVMAELPTPEEELVPWTQTVRPTGPRARDGDPVSSYTGKDVRVTTDGQTWEVAMRRELSAEEFDRLQRSGFDPVDDACLTWQASAQVVRDAGTDVNILAVTLDRKGERLGRVR